MPTKRSVWKTKIGPFRFRKQHNLNYCLNNIIVATTTRSNNLNIRKKKEILNKCYVRENYL